MLFQTRGRNQPGGPLQVPAWVPNQPVTRLTSKGHRTRFNSISNVCRSCCITRAPVTTLQLCRGA
jgi:hypothetical protein